MKAIAMKAPGGPELLEFQKLPTRRWVRMINLSLFVIFANSTHAEEIYRCNDEKGHIAFSDVPCSEGAEKIEIKSPPPPPTGMRMKLFHNGKPIETVSQAEPLFSVELQTKEGGYFHYIRASPMYDRYPKRYDPNEKIYTVILDVSREGTYAGYAAVDANPKNPVDYPGDYRGWFLYLRKEMHNVFNKSLDKLIHLLLPQDNNMPLLKSVHSCEHIYSTKAPLRIMWDSLGPNVEYAYQIKPLKCMPYCCEPKLSIVHGSTMDTLVTHDLPVNKDDEIYSLTLHAWDKVTKNQVGSLLSHGERGQIEEYRFRIVE